MEVPGMEEAKSHMTSAAAFVEGGVQEACDDACSICLEGFCDSDPSAVTNCKHEFHLQCVLECQELLEAVERERSFRSTPSRNSRIFHHSTLGDFELQHLPVGVNDAELEDRIIQHLAAAAAMGRTHRIARREGLRSRSSAHARSQFVVYSPRHPNGSSTGAGGEEETETAHVNNGGAQHNMPPSSEALVMPITGRGLSGDDRYKESISKSTKELKEKLFSRSSTMADIGSEVRREVNNGIATVSRMMERLEARDNNRDTETFNFIYARIESNFRSMFIFSKYVKAGDES
ncbi:E3 ubiquitin-protein ligase rhf2a [Phtheirospermum japonicum]|uniref:RING-type E3 ubiquitin transferase n=1 Tax=Phtheirospermum japonicum TaxID=374723 RepID=A0A830BQG3_9LAMI|nr:E3 ubiquitin-protein ligase rhf2a [Phtheirospermum japonicum]